MLTSSKSIDFIVPDNGLGAGLEVLSQLESLTPCLDGKRCPSSSPDRCTPAPAVHVHVEASEVTVGLYPQADILWFLPPLDGPLLFPRRSKLPPHFVLASDDTGLPPWRPGRGSGVFKEGVNQVVALKPHVLLEAVMRIYARDAGTRVGTFGLSMVAYIEEYVDDDGFLDVSELPETFRTFYGELREGRKPVRLWTVELKRALQVS